MDSRSKAYISNQNIKDSFHTPIKITNDLVQDAIIVLAMDMHILKLLNHKFRALKQDPLFSYGKPQIDTSDPFKYDNENTKKLWKILMNYQKLS